MLKKNQISNLLLIGATGQNRGKTHLACSIIEEFSTSYNIVALKITSLFEEENKFHSPECIRGNLAKGYLLYKEDNSTGHKDSQKMLKAGAKNSYYLKANEDGLIAGWTEFLSCINENEYVVCEAGRLRNIVYPALFFMIEKEEEARGKIKIEKKSSLHLLKLADRILLTNDSQFDFNINKIKIENAKWKLKK